MKKIIKISSPIRLEIILCAGCSKESPHWDDSCADPESFIRKLWQCFFFKLMRGYPITTFSGHHRPASQTPFKWGWWPNIECWLESFVIIRGSGPVLLKKLYFCDFQGGEGVRTPCIPRLDPPMRFFWVLGNLNLCFGWETRKMIFQFDTLI